MENIKASNPNRSDQLDTLPPSGLFRTRLRLGPLVVAVTGGAIVAAMAAYAANLPPPPPPAIVVTPVRSLHVDAQAAAERLAGAVRIRTISYDDQPAAPETFQALHDYIDRQFPNVRRALRREVVNQSSLLYTWEGADPSARPIVLMAHQDVVPISPGTEQQWRHPPFSGEIAEGYVWGRGSWDDKGNLFAIMEAAEMLAAQGFQPPQTIYLAFGHDEETGATAGQQGAHEIAALLKARGVRLASVLDEGLLITHGQMKGLDTPVALIGVAEKGYITLHLSTEAVNGHSSMAPERNAIAILSMALVRMNQHQFPLRLSPVVREMLETVAPEFHGLNHIALSNLWLFGPLVSRQLAATPGGAAMLHTTTAITRIEAGNKDQVLPARAEAHVNFRILPGDSIQEVISHTRCVVHDPSVNIATAGAPWEASRVSSTNSPAYRMLKQSIEEVFPGAVVAPGLMVGATDSRHYADISDDVYRFTPVHAWPEDLPRFHGTNERVSVANYADMIRFYYRLMSSPAISNVR